ncbi:hypothetical protein P8452_55838 [Trifolium repens]|nr:hypothetical protein P8452_55838 [Trifolium repens]
MALFLSEETFHMFHLLKSFEFPSSFEDRKWEGSFTMVFGRWILLNATVLPYPKHTHPCSYFPESWL